MNNNGSCTSNSNVYTFVIKAMDDYCPAPAINIKTITIILQACSQPSPPVQCVKVQPNGDVILQWSPIMENDNLFRNYVIYSSSNPGGPFNYIGSVSPVDTSTNVGICTFHHVGANALNSPRYYQIKTKAGCPGYVTESFPFDTVSSIHLKVQNFGNGGATLNWNAIRPVHLNTSGKIYEIYRRGTSSNWALIDSTNLTHYFDTVRVCEDTMFYRIEIVDTLLRFLGGGISECFSNSNIGMAHFTDTISPSIPIINLVSIDSATQKVKIEWNESLSSDTRYYLIYFLHNNTWQLMDTVTGINSLIYIDSLHYPCDTTILWYCIAAADSCGNISNKSLPHNTISLIVEADFCEDKISLNWNSYQALKQGFKKFGILFEDNGKTIHLIDSLSVKDTNFVHNKLLNNHSYCYTIKAMNNDGRKAISCRKCVKIHKPNQPEYNYLSTASVSETNNAVELKIYTDNTAGIKNYTIEREDVSSIWKLVSKIPPSSYPSIQYLDKSALVRQKSYSYRIQAIDSCGDTSRVSNIGKTIFLQATANSDFTNTLYWNPYRLWFGDGIERYEIYRFDDGVFIPVPVVTIPADCTTYIDDVSNVLDKNGIFDYYVKAYDYSDTVDGSFDYSRSNTVRVFQKPRIYIPNAFYPNSDEDKNRFFLPKGIFVNSGDYEFIILNRWGQELFHTFDNTKGWDGKFNGEDVEMGVYTYILRFTYADGLKYERSGTLTLVR